MNKQDVTTALHGQGFLSLSAWARARGYHPIRVHTVLDRWLHRAEGMRRPRGETAQIVRELEETLGKEVLEKWEPPPFRGRKS